MAVPHALADILGIGVMPEHGPPPRGAAAYLTGSHTGRPGTRVAAPIHLEDGLGETAAYLKGI